jgi:GDP-L-fucose synthase
MDRDSRIFVAGHRGLVGSAICRALRRHGFENIIERSRAQLELTSQAAVEDFFASERPQYVFLAAAKVGGIHANNTYPAEFIYDNLAVQCNVIHAAWRHGVKKLAFLGSSCIYPRDAAQPMREEALLSGPLEPTNEWYAIAKIAGIETCQAYRRQYGFDAISLMPTNLYGPEDNFDLQNSHVLPALIRKVHEARQAGAPEVVMWGSGTPRREFMYVDDMAEATLFLMRNYSDAGIVNVGLGEDISIAELVRTVADIVGYQGRIVQDRSKPDGMPRKLLDVSRLHALGWRASTSLREGIARTYAWYQQQLALGAPLRGVN